MTHPSESESYGPKKHVQTYVRSTRKTRMQILYCIDRYLEARTGHVKKLKPPRTGFRLRCGDFRVFFDPSGDNGIEITAVRNRKDAYR